jgi:hypothetical protein
MEGGGEDQEHSSMRKIRMQGVAGRNSSGVWLQGRRDLDLGAAKARNDVANMHL